MNHSILSPEDIINSYNKFGEKFLIIDLSTITENQAKNVKYCKIKIKKENKEAPFIIINNIYVYIITTGDCKLLQDVKMHCLAIL